MVKNKTISQKSSNNPKPSSKSKKKKQINYKNIAIACFLLLILTLSSIAFYISNKTGKTNKNNNKSIYVSAEKKKDVASKSKKEKIAKNSDKKTSNQSAKEKSNENSDLNKFISATKEWQPVNAELTKATDKFKNLVYGGAPITKGEVTVLENLPYYTGYCEKRKNPLWVGYRLDPYKGQNKLPRPGGFTKDKRTKAKIDPKIYSKLGYDRGHLCPNSAIAARYGKQGQKETFLMSNICPQKPNLNRKVWERLERLEENYANRFNGIYIITGPIFDEHIELMDRKVEIPDAFFKILIDEDKGKVRVLPFIFPQNVTGKEILNDYITSVDEIEKQTGLDFFAPMNDEFENKLEAYIPAKSLWN